MVRLAIIVFAAVSFVVIGDTAGKLLTARGVEPFFIAWTRFALAAVVLLPFSGISLSEFSHFKDWRVVARAAAIAAGICCILTALRTEPIANVFGAFFIGPIVAYVLAVVFLGEAPSRTRSLLLALGFVGVLLVVKPGFGMTAGMGFALAAGGFYGAYLAATRMVAPSYRPRFLLLSQLIIGSILLTPLGLAGALPDFEQPITMLIVISAVGSAIGNFLLVVASKTAEASLIAPLIYSQLISATVAGLIVFGDLPDAIAFVGLVLIAVSGFGSLALHRGNGQRV